MKSQSLKQIVIQKLSCFYKWSLVLAIFVVLFTVSSTETMQAQTTTVVVKPLGSGFESSWPGYWVKIQTQNSVYCSQDSSNVIYTRTRTPPYTNVVDWARWRPNLPTGGLYDVYAYIPSYSSSSTVTSRARYKITHADGSNTVTVNQTQDKCNWKLLGRYRFNAGTTGNVYMGDYTGDDPWRLIAADGMKFVQVSSSISGQVVDSNGNLLSGVTISDGTRTATTDANGNYTISNVPSGNYTLTPTKTGYSFSPTSRTVSVPPDGTSQNFTGTLSAFSIAGRVTDSNGDPLAGVDVSNGTTTITTDSNGDYTLTGLSAGTYTITPNKTGYSTCVPSSRSVTGPPNQTGQDFVCEPDPIYSISGTIKDKAGNPIEGVTVADGGGNSAITDSSGNYTIGNLLSGTYTLTPDKAGYVFSPDYRSVTLSSEDVSGQDFTAQEVYSISGRILDANDNPIPDIPIAILGPQYPTTYSNSSGDYLAENLRRGWYYIRASSSGTNYTLWPSIRRVNLPPSATEQNFTATPLYGTLTGRVTEQGSGKAIANARVSVAGKVVKTNSNGDYTVNDVLPGNHTVRISAANYKDHKGSVVIRASTAASHNAQLKLIHPDGYRLPWQANVASYCSQGNGGAFSHRWGTSSQYAYDFSRNGGKNVVASRAGKVIKVVERFAGSCYNWSSRSCSSQCLQSANQVRIQHADGTVSVYLHLRKDSVPVHVGQYVSSGQVIGRVGTTGCSTGEHIHFQRNVSSWKWWSVRTSFLDVSSNGGIPTRGSWYTSDNRLIASTEIGPQADTEPPIGNVTFRLTGEVTHTVRIDAFDYESDTIQMRMASSEEDLQAQTWQIITGTKTVAWTAYEVYVELKDQADNTAIYSDVVEATAFEEITPAFDIHSPICVGQTIDLENKTVPFCEQCGWHWDMGNGTTSDLAEPHLEFIGNYPVFSYDTPGSYTMRLSVANIDGVSSTDRQVEALPNPSPDFTLTRSGTTITVEASTTDATNWLWDFGDGTTATGRIATHTYTAEALDQNPAVQLTVEGSNGCDSSAHQYIETGSNNLYLPIIVK